MKPRYITEEALWRVDKCPHCPKIMVGLSRERVAKHLKTHVKKTRR